MSSEDVLNLLANFERRLATIADQAAETREQAQHTLERINRLRQDLAQFKDRLLATADTGTHPVLRATPPD
jgi:regulator of replication initiation timing